MSFTVGDEVVNVFVDILHFLVVVAGSRYIGMYDVQMVFTIYSDSELGQPVRHTLEAGEIAGPMFLFTMKPTPV